MQHFELFVAVRTVSKRKVKEKFVLAFVKKWFIFYVSFLLSMSQLSNLRTVLKYIVVLIEHFKSRMVFKIFEFKFFLRFGKGEIGSVNFSRKNRRNTMRDSLQFIGYPGRDDRPSFFREKKIFRYKNISNFLLTKKWEGEDFFWLKKGGEVFLDKFFP